MSMPLPLTVYADCDTKVNDGMAVTFFTSIVEFFVAPSTQVCRVAEQLRNVYQTLGTVYAILIPVPMARFAEPRRTVKDSPHNGGFELRISSVTDRVGALPVRVFGEADVISKRLIDRKGEIARIGVEYGDPHFSPYLGDLVAETYGVPFSDSGLSIVYTWNYHQKGLCQKHICTVEMFIGLSVLVEEATFSWNQGRECQCGPRSRTYPRGLLGIYQSTVSINTMIETCLFGGLSVTPYASVDDFRLITVLLRHTLTFRLLVYKTLLSNNILFATTNAFRFIPSTTIQQTL